MLFGQVTGSMAGQFEDGGTAHAPVGDEQWTLGTEGGGGNASDGIFHHESLEASERGVVDGEGEEGGDTSLLVWGATNRDSDEIEVV